MSYDQNNLQYTRSIKVKVTYSKFKPLRLKDVSPKYANTGIACYLAMLIFDYIHTCGWRHVSP